MEWRTRYLGRRGSNRRLQKTAKPSFLTLGLQHILFCFREVVDEDVTNTPAHRKPTNCGNAHVCETEGAYIRKQDRCVVYLLTHLHFFLSCGATAQLGPRPPHDRGFYIAQN
jgi:hypothetical protein